VIFCKVFFKKKSLLRKLLIGVLPASREKYRITFVVSHLLDLESTGAPKNVRELPYKFSADKFERVELTDEATLFPDTYIAEKVVGKTSLEDCRHIVNLDRIKGYNSVNYWLRYPMIEIRSPKDLIHYED